MCTPCNLRIASYIYMNESRKKGFKAGLSVVPTFLAIFIGFGIAARVADVPAPAAVLLTLAVYAAPAQFAIIELNGQGAVAIVQMIFAGILINLRFFLMSLTLSHFFTNVPRRRMLITAHFVAASSYLLTFFQSRKKDGKVNLHDFYFSMTMVAFPAAAIGTLIGVAFGTNLHPAIMFGASLFLPVYFALLLSGDVKGRYEITAALCGFVFTPPVELLLPGWGVFVSALGVGAAVTVAEKQ